MEWLEFGSLSAVGSSALFLPPNISRQTRLSRDALAFAAAHGSAAWIRDAAGQRMSSMRLQVRMSRMRLQVRMRVQGLRQGDEPVKQCL